MSLVKLNLSRLSVPDKLDVGRQIVLSMTGNAHFATPHPPLAEVTTAFDDLEHAYRDGQEARVSSKTKTIIQNGKEDLVDKLLRQLIGYVVSIAGDDQEIILSAGMGVRAVPGTTTTPSPPTGLSSSAGDRDGEIDLSWDPAPNAVSYVVETSLDPATATSWTNRTVSTKSSFTFNGLNSGTRYWFHVAAINPAGQSGWSDPSGKIAP